MAVKPVLQKAALKRKNVVFSEFIGDFTYLNTYINNNSKFSIL